MSIPWPRQVACIKYIKQNNFLLDRDGNCFCSSKFSKLNINFSVWLSKEMLLVVVFEIYSQDRCFKNIF